MGAFGPYDVLTLPIRAALYGLAARLAAESRPTMLHGILSESEAMWTLDAIVELADNGALRQALADLGPSAGGVLSACTRRATVEVLEHGTPRELGRLVERQVLDAAYVLCAGETA